MFYIIPYYSTLRTVFETEAVPFHTAELDAALDAAKRFSEKDGKHWNVIEVKTVWTTKTLTDRSKEKANV